MTFHYCEGSTETSCYLFFLPALVRDGLLIVHAEFYKYSLFESQLLPLTEPGIKTKE